MKPMTRYNRTSFYRLYQIDKYIKEKCYPNTFFLAEKFEVANRTVQRDIEYMRDSLSAPIEYCRNRKGYYYEKDFQMPALQFTEGEIIALYFGQKIVNNCLGTVLEAPMKNAFGKILASCNDIVSVDFGQLEKITSFDFDPVRGEEKQLIENYALISKAARNKKTVWIKYYTATKDEINERHIDPYHLRYHQGVWYVVGFCHLRNDMRHFALDRILEVKITEKLFKIIKGFNIEKYFKSAFGVEWGANEKGVLIYFDSYQARWIREKRWHCSQKTEENEDGSLLLSLKVNGLREIKSWVLSFGNHAKVLQPLELQMEIVEEIKKMAEQYL